MKNDLSSSKIIQELKNRSTNDSQAATLFGLLYPILEDVTPLLEYIRHSFPGYTDHGINHSMRVLERIGGILSPEAIKSLSSYEIFCLALAAIFHDLGMVDPNSSQPNDEDVRIIHHIKSAKFFLKYISEQFKGFNNERMAKVVAFAIECHGISWEDMKGKPEFSKSEKVDGQVIRFCVIAILLRIGDLLDLDSDRTSDLCLQHCAAWYTSADSINHNERHKCVDHFNYNEKEIEVSVICANRSQYNIWFSWLEYLRMEIERANTYVFLDSLSVFRLPVPKLECKPSEEAKFELWQLRFELDETGAFWDVITKSIYTGRHDYVRELVQNSIDACLKRIYESSDSYLEVSSPRNWKLTNYNPVVLIILSQEDEKLIVADNGIGMDKHALQNFLFRVSGSGMRRGRSDRPFAFPSIAMFGVGFISVLTRAKKVKITTKYSMSEDLVLNKNGLAIYLDASLRDAIVEKSFSPAIGTKITVNVKDRSYITNIRSYLTNLIKYPAVEVNIVNKDALKQVYNLIQEHELEVPEIQNKVIKEILADTSNEPVFDVLTTIKEFNKNWFEKFSHIIKSHNETTTKNQQVSRPFLTESESYDLSFQKFITTIKADTPESLPIDKPRYFTISQNAEIVSGFVLSNRPIKNAIAYLLVVPVQFIDLNIGIEWRSLHSILITKNQAVKSVSFVKSEVFGNRTVTLPINYIHDDEENYRYYDKATPNDDFYEEYMDEIMEMEDTVYDLVDRMRDAQDAQNSQISNQESSREGLYGNALYVKRNDVERYEDVNFSMRVESNYSMSESIFDSIADLDKQDTDTFEWYKRNEQSVYQDGFLLPIKLCDLAPVGATVGVANLFADSRLAFNVSRNAIDESIDKKTAWQANVGNRILKEIQQNVEKSLQKFNASYSWDNLNT